MNYSLSWMADEFRAAGLGVVETKNKNGSWKNHGHGDMGKVLGVLCHHTGGPKEGNMKDLQVIIDGRSDLPGPLSQLALGRDGTFFMVAAGTGWHAGRGNWQGVTNGNSHLIGIEAENTGELTGPRADPWPEVQLDAYARGVAVILKHYGLPPAMCAGHKEYALPKGRKDDPTFDMGMFRGRVAKIMGGLPPAQPAQPRDSVANVSDLAVRAEPAASSKLIRRLKKGDTVRVIGEYMNDTTKWYKIDDGFVAAKYVDLK